MDMQGGAGSPRADWYADPAGRHQSRYWDGAAWTEHVADNGKSSLDPLQGRPADKVDARASAVAPVRTTTAAGVPNRTSSAPAACKAYQGGRCVVQGADTGPCDWNPSDWQHCGVVIENKKCGGW
jgi:hypothetical protein